MDNGYNGNVSADSLLWARGAGFGGYNYGQGSFASPASNAVRINRNEGVTRDSAACLQGTMGATLDRISAQNFEGRFNSAITSLRDGQFQAELRNGDRLRDVERLMIDGQKEAAQCCCDAKLEALKCCCETQKLITAEASATRDLINQNTIRAAVDTNNINATVGAINANANANTAAIVNAINNQCPPA